MVESYVGAVAERHHIDYQFNDLEYVGLDYDDDGDDGGDNFCGYDGSDNGELSFDYRKNFQEKNVIYTSRNSIEVKSLRLCFVLILVLLCTNQFPTFPCC